MIEGKLTELNRHPRAVQVEVQEGKDDKVMVCLCDYISEDSVSHINCA